jgi:hypothetical protein
MTKPTEKLAKAWIKEAQSLDGESNQPIDEIKKSGCNYEKWNMRIVRDSDGSIKEFIPSFKVKDVRIDDEVAERMNRSVAISDRGYAIKYIRKQEVNN